MRRSSAWAWAALAAGLATGACGSTPATPPERRSASVAEGPEGFRDARGTLSSLAALRATRNAAAARALAPRVLSTGRRLTATERPEDLRREDVARFLEGRARFIDALNAFDRAAAGADDEALWSASDRVEAAFWAWYDAYRGVPAEGAV